MGLQRVKRKSRAVFSAALAIFLLVLFQNCGRMQSLSGGGASGAASTAGDLGPTPFEYALRRLSTAEVDNSLALILEDSSRPAARLLPADALSPFDNDMLVQNPSVPLIEGLENVAADVAKRLIAEKARRDRVIGCATAAAADSACMRTVAARLSRLFLRRAVSAAETDELAAFASGQASAGGSFDSGVDALLRALIQHPEFVYRFEIGAPDGDGFRLTGFELASRLAFFIWGSGPDATLLTLAESGGLTLAAQVRQTASDMLASPRATARLQHFHAQWLGYIASPHAPEIASASRQEADFMVENVMFSQNQPWRGLLTTRQSRINNVLGDIYGIGGLTSAFGGISLTGERQGILGTVAMLSVAPKFGDTSPTQRGKFIRERILCQVIPPPPPSVDVDSPPPPVAGQPDCKFNRYDNHRRAGTSCFGCHQQMDPVGFGLEKYDRFGRFRSYDYLADGSPNMSCPIAGQGELTGIGTFSGPAALADLLVQSGQAEACMIRRLYQFGFGHKPTGQSEPYLDSLGDTFALGGGRMKNLILSLVTSDHFLRRRGN
jgi:hypothetical protein